MNILRIKADIITAKNNLSSVGNPTNDDYLYAIAAAAKRAIEIRVSLKIPYASIPNA